MQSAGSWDSEKQLRGRVQSAGSWDSEKQVRGVQSARLRVTGEGALWCGERHLECREVWGRLGFGHCKFVFVWLGAYCLLVANKIPKIVSRQSIL